MNNVTITTSKYDELVENTRLLNEVLSGESNLVKFEPVMVRVAYYGRNDRYHVCTDLNIETIKENTLKHLVKELKTKESNIVRLKEKHKEALEIHDSEYKLFRYGFATAALVLGIIIGWSF